MPPLVKLADLVPEALTRVTDSHMQHVVNQVGPVTLAEVEEKIPDAAAIHAREWDRTAHPMDSHLDSRVHDWAIKHIALNLVAEGRGCRIGSLRERMVYAPPASRLLQLTPAARIGED
jgi:hypothetical protein